MKITGSARAPLVKLYANPDLPDSEKLAWLVLGRPASGTGAEAAILQQAALALLSGSGGAIDASLASRAWGWTKLPSGVHPPRPMAPPRPPGWPGQTPVQQAVRGLRNQPEHGNGHGVAVLTTSRRLTLRARAGEENAIDLIFTIPHD